MIDLNILWLVPLAYLIHICEETPRFLPWAIKYYGAPETFKEFVIGNVIFMIGVIIAVSLAIFYTNTWTIIIGLATAAWIFTNFIMHAYYTLRYGEYSPGVVTASAIYAPVAVFIYYNFLVSGIISTTWIILSFIIGFGVMYIPTLIQMKRHGKI